MKFNPSCPDLRPRERAKSNFYFQTSLRCLKRLYEGLKGLQKPFQAPQRRVEIKIKVNFILLQLSEMRESERIKQKNQ